jgi:hypothetical protein
MKKQSLLSVILVPFVLLVLLSSSVSGQNDKVLNVNVIVSDSTGKVLKDVAIYNSKQNLIGITNNFGTTTITAHLGDVLVFSHISYEQKTMKVPDENMLVILNAKTNILPEAEVVENVPHLAYNNKKVWVTDYKITKNGMYLILNNNREHTLILLSHDQDTLTKTKIRKDYEYLYEDVIGNIHIYSADSVYQTYYDGENLHLLYPTSVRNLRKTLMPCQVLTDSLLILQSYACNYGEIIYVSVNRKTKETKVLADVYRESARAQMIDKLRDQKMDEMENEFPLFVNVLDVFGLKRYSPEEDLYYEESFVDFKTSMRARYVLNPIYCPIVFVKDTIYVFDFEQDKLKKFTENGIPVSETDISFHRTTYRKDSRIGNTWDRNIIVDKALGKCYAQFSKDGHVTLKEIDLQTGTIKKTIELTRHVFPENIQIHNGIVYYKFIDVRQVNGRDCRSLYKMQLK